MSSSNIKIDEFGSIDLAYYRRQGELARAAFLLQGIKSISGWLKSLVRIERFTPFQYHLSAR
ncbi:hypothetical protein DV711_05125 [Motiliproteus coralliicola]|uniref:Uncharacterized protein n=1 Tax=Motiliproteus coralliicola TaxID=2283196 RepID=A0A369WV67_9GAMM|nr:hypothetical protein [Motiliproteus coralliicola]RDE24959.1 hypothetical protein DV711_05125 [Motiliproteus coralliicola]